jgi:hypothetical protein
MEKYMHLGKNINAKYIMKRINDKEGKHLMNITVLEQTIANGIN